jgi:hypothetical protein
VQRNGASSGLSFLSAQLHITRLSLKGVHNEQSTKLDPSSDCDLRSEREQHQHGTESEQYQGQATVTGCLSGPNDEGAYVLKSGQRPCLRAWR